MSCELCVVHFNKAICACYNTETQLLWVHSLSLCAFIAHVGILKQKPLGLVSLLDEESNFPKATSLTFAAKLKQHLSANYCFKGDGAGAFTVCHYAGEVSSMAILLESSYRNLSDHGSMFDLVSVCLHECDIRF